MRLRPDDADWATMARVTKDMNTVNKGQMWVAKGQRYAKATETLEKMVDLEDTELSAKEKARREDSQMQGACRDLREDDQEWQVGWCLL